MEATTNLTKDTNSNNELVTDSNSQLNESVPENSTVPELKLTQPEENQTMKRISPLTLMKNGTHYSDALEPLSDNIIIDDTLIPTSQKAQTQHIKFLHLQLDHLRKELDLQQKNYTNQLELSYRDLARVRADANFSTRNRELITNRYKALESDYIELQEELENLKFSHNSENTEKLKLKLKDYKLSLNNCKEQMQEYLETNRESELLLNRMTTELEELQTKYNDLMGKYIEATTEINDQSSKKRKLNTEESEDSKLTEAAQFMSHFKSLVEDNLQLKTELQLAKNKINNLIQTSIQPSELESIKRKHIA
ncbi:hypothetical protein CONCODRAFT_169982 [Conidiobolus coronatus NRRL 28638]|uniref:Uncharacterized protein n=1 Tax=Conidiobolus coronatus (strain ATCC 28846 / CBS 209.66 / NRRL 28638) TaxID=796925 RepID=A0A137P8L9_CONC2|nr:hypothetical protein CONCODRAFT_169982 [Conidiobolus coronatus NRRL 28638]|eukprot:KXN71356.1 hypothetical protein CONCODRAFT_169982 [Conidiobolus coronatus NRRL 28638]